MSTTQRTSGLWRVLGGLVGLLTLLAGCSGTDPVPGPSPAAPTTSPTGPVPAPSASASPTPSDGAASSTVKLSFGGDVMFQGGLAELLERSQEALEPVRGPVSDADFTMVNLESSITTRGEPDAKELEDPDNRYHFRSGPEVLTALNAAGVDAVSVANNHGVDFGAEGLADTLAAKETSPVAVLGVGRNRAEALTPHRVTLRGQPFAFLAADASFLESRAPQWQAGDRTPGLAAARGAGRAALLAAVQQAAAAGDTVVVYLHWGEENEVEVSGGQQALARDLSAAGAAAVVGSHTHELQGAGWRGRTYVAYGLGNFVWYHGARGGATGLLDLTVRDGAVVADGWRPAVIPPEGGLPEFLDGDAAASATADWRRLRGDAELSGPPRTADPAGAPFTSTVGPITAALRERMGSTHRSGCPVPLSELRHLRLSHWDFGGRSRVGELVVAADEAAAVRSVFAELYAARFPIERMQLVSEYDGDDDASMAANNSSAFNCRSVAGTDRWSQHSYGTAIDLNPVQNPYVTESVAPPEGRRYAEPGARSADVPGLITADSVVVRAFREAGWEWGGDWSSPKDYQHFSASGG